MKILVPVKRVIDPNIAVRIDETGTNVVRHNVPHAMNPFDEVALGQAAVLRTDGTASELVAVSIGPEKAAETLRTALAMGADRAIHIVTEQIPPFDIARILQKVCDEERPDLILMGKQAIDSDAGQTAALLAGFLHLPFLPDSAELTIEENTVFTSFDLNGSKTRAKASLPAVISCELHLFEPRPISLPQMMKAKQKTIDAKNLEELGVELTKAITISALIEPAPRPPCQLFDNVSDLAQQLKTDGLLK
jgi:electron transfer flavoprotein beta subunit